MNEFVATLVPAIGTALVRFTWQGLAIGLAAAVALQLARHAKPQARYAIAGLALLACALIPLAGVLAHLAAYSPTGPALAAGTPGEATDVGALRFVGNASRIDTLLPLIVALWAAGASVFCLRTLGGLAWIARLRAAPQPPLQATWQARLDALALRFGLRGVGLKLVDALDSPVVAGWWRPVVLLPTAIALRMPADAVEALLAHELAHVKRMDYLVNLLQRVVEALLFFHPVVWWLSRRVRIERELVADRLAADALGDARRLARALAVLSDLQATPRAHPHLAQAAHGGHLMSRIQQLLPRSPTQRLPAGRVALPLIGVAAACIAFYAQAQIGRDAKATATTTAAATTPATEAQAAADAASAERVAAGYAADTAARASTLAEAHAATAAAQAERSAHVAAARATEVARSDRGDRHAFALVHKGEDGYAMSGSTDDMDDIDAAKLSLQDDFLWFRRDGKAYVIDDPALVARADAAWQDSHVLGKKMEGLGAQMEVHGKKMEAYGAQMEKLSEHHRPSDAMMAAQERVQVLAEEQAALAGKQALLAMKQRRTDDDKTEMQLDREMDALGAQMDKLGEQLDAQTAILERESQALERNTAPMEALGRQMEEASKPMDVLGKQMGELGRQQEQLAKRAMAETDKIIDEGMRNGKAKPAPTRH
jgi:beta-lactamase regulating signal transducer with metallopeptidase domain